MSSRAKVWSLLATSLCLAVPPAQAADFLHLVGALHEHSGYSDGTVGTQPRDYFAQGKARGLDFVGSAEHSDNNCLPLTVSDECLSPEGFQCVLADDDDPADSFRKWAATAEQAAAATDENFVAFRGFEWTSDRFGHINLFFSTHTLNAKASTGYAVSMEVFWNWFSLDPAFGGGGDAIAAFNHPGREDTVRDTPIDGFTWNDFEYRAEAAERVVGLEVFSKSSRRSADIARDAPGGSWLAHALAKGWRLAPVGSEDHHGTDWGSFENLPKTVVLATERSAAAIREAMLARRNYALARGHSDLRIDVDAGGHPMGAEIASEAAIRYVAEVRRADGEAFSGEIEVVGRGNQVIASSGPGATRLEVTLAPTAAKEFYFLRVRLDAPDDSVSDGIVAYAAPVWLQRPSPAD